MENKGNSKTKSSSNLKSYFKNSKSGIPRSASAKRKPSADSAQKKQPTDSTKKRHARPAPDFSRLHQKWQTKLEYGKHCTKKPCTVSQEFDLTHPGTTFSRVEQREITPGNDLLSSLCDVQMDCDDDEIEEILPATLPHGGPRRVLGELSSMEVTYNSPVKQETKTMKMHKPDVRPANRSHILQEQSEIADKFETDSSSLASILSGQGIGTRGGKSVAMRLTQIPNQSSKSSMYTPKVARLSMKMPTTASLFGDDLVPVPIRNSIYVKYERRPQANLIQNTTPTSKPCRTPITAGRVPNPAFSVLQFSASRVESPASCLRPSVAGTTPRARKILKWADVLANPDSEKEAVARELTQRDYEEDTENRPPSTNQSSKIRHTPQLLHQDKEINSPLGLRETTNSAEMAKGEETTGRTVAETRNGQRENIQPVVKPNVTMKITEVDIQPNGFDESISQKSVSEVGQSDLQTFIKKTLKRRRRSVDEINQSLSETRVYVGELTSEAKRLCCVRGGNHILQQLSLIEQQQQQLAKLQQDLQKQLQSRLLHTPHDNVAPDENCNSPTSTMTNSTITTTRLTNDAHQKTCSPISEIPEDIHEAQDAPPCPNFLKTEIPNFQISVGTLIDNSLPLDLSVRSKNTYKRKTPDIFHLPSISVQDVPSKNSRNGESDESEVQLTPYITRGVEKLQLTTEKGEKSNPSEVLEPQRLSADFDYANEKDAGERCRLPVPDMSDSMEALEGPSSLCNRNRPEQTTSGLVKGSPWNIVSPVSERALNNRNNSYGDNNIIVPPPPIWTPLALKCAGAMNSSNQAINSSGQTAIAVMKPQSLAGDKSSHGVFSADSIVGGDSISRCESGDDSSSQQCLTSLPQSSSTIHQSTTPDRGRVQVTEDGTTSRHLTSINKISPGQVMTHHAASACLYNTTCNSTSNSSLSSAGCFHNSASSTSSSWSLQQSTNADTSTSILTHKICGQSNTDNHKEESAPNNHTVCGKDGLAYANKNQNHTSHVCNPHSALSLSPSGSIFLHQPSHSDIDQNFRSSHSGSHLWKSAEHHKDHKTAFRNSRTLLQSRRTVEHSQQQQSTIPPEVSNVTADSETFTCPEDGNSNLGNRPESHSVSLQPTSTWQRQGTIGSLSLRANVRQASVAQGRFPETPQLRSAQVHRHSPRIQERLQGANQMFLEALLDEECALFTCRLQQTSTPDTPARCLNPVAKVLSEGDSMHFLPVSEDYHGNASQLEGSAFSSYTPSHTRSMSRMH